MSILEEIPVVAEFFVSEDVIPDSWCSGLHSGNIGDIIYSLPTCRMLNINHIILNICADPRFGARVLNEQAARALAPLLLAQKFIRRVTIIKSGVPWEYANPADLGVNYILDSFRASYTDPRLHLLYAHAVPFNLMVDGAQPWVTVGQSAPEQQTKQEPYIVVGLTSRYRRFNHAYYEYLLRNVPADRVFFVGIGTDQIERRNIGGTVFQTANFMDLAKLLANAALFIGNPSFAYALAEGLKVNRFLEVPEDNNVYPLDGSGSLLHMYAPEYVRAKIFEALKLEDASLSSRNPPPAVILENMPYAQLFFDAGSGFNERESLARPVATGVHRYSFDDFPKDATIRSLRFDPIGDHAIVRINRVQLSNQAGEQTLIPAAPTNATYIDSGECYFTHSDPQFLIKVSKEFQRELKEITVDMDIIAIGQAGVTNSIYPKFGMLAAERDQLTSERDRLTSERDELAAKQDRLLAENGSLTAEQAQLVAKLDKLVADRSQLTAERDHLTAERNHLAAERDQLTAQRNQILASHSWRLTAPLRRFVRLFATR